MSEFNNLDLNLLRTFDAVMQAGSINGASEKLNVSPSAVSLAMGRLKKELQCELFIRRKTSIEPTAASIMLHNNIAPQLLAIEQSYLAFNKFNPLDAIFKFRLSAPEQLHPLLLKSLPTLSNPKLKFALLEQGLIEEQTVTSLRERSIDLAIDNMIIDDLSIESEKLYEEEVVIVCRKDHPILLGSISLEQYQTMPQVVLNKRRNNQYPLNMFIGDTSLPRNIAHETNSLMASLVIASDSDLFCHLTKTLADKFLDSHNLQILTSPITFRSMPYYMMWHKANSQSEPHNWLRQRVKLACHL